MSSERLSREIWVDAGLDALARDGGASLKAEVLAKRLGVSRGSFYWHFADLDAFHAAVVERWRDIAVEGVIRALERGARKGRLRHLLGLALRADPGLEIGMRAWGVSCERARAAVATVDARRLTYLAYMLVADGVAPDASEARACVIYWTYLGSALSRAEAGGAMLDRLIEELAAFATRREGV